MAFINIYPLDMANIYSKYLKINTRITNTLIKIYIFTNNIILNFVSQTINYSK